MTEFFNNALIHGARIQEMLDIKLNDLRLDGTPTVTLLGKNGIPRKVALMEATVKHLNHYLSVFHPNADFYANDYLFYVKRRNGNKRMTEDNARRRVRYYGNLARLNCPEIPKDIHPHLFRHSRAMHLYQHGMPLAWFHSGSVILRLKLLLYMLTQILKWNVKLLKPQRQMAVL